MWMAYETLISPSDLTDTAMIAKDTNMMKKPREQPLVLGRPCTGRRWCRSTSNSTRIHTVSAAWESVRKDVVMYGGYLHPALEFRTAIDWMGAELVATSDIGGENTLLWVNRENQATTLTVDNVFSTFPDLLGVFTSSKTNEIESDLFGWYLAYLRNFEKTTPFIVDVFA